jgi:ATP-dependent helicase/nuclease subunit A
MSFEPQRASDKQIEASNPAQSVWVAANAGSGKTHVLVDRVIRLMLAGSEPAKILCLTFTKAAAAEMANRLFERLSAWIALNDEQLYKFIAAIGHTKVSQLDLVRARKLFTLAMETPGGLKIQTIHAFCERLLQLFPVEAGIMPGFRVMDDVEAADVLLEARQSVIAAARKGGDLAKALDAIAARVQAVTFDELIGKLLDKRTQIADVLSGSQAIEAAIRELGEHAGLLAGETANTIQSELVAIDRAVYASMIQSLGKGTAKTDATMMERLKSVMASQDDDRCIELLQTVFITDGGLARSASTLMTNKLAASDPTCQSCLIEERDRVFKAFGKLSLCRMFEATRDLLTLASGIVERYERLKRERGLYDFVDLIARTQKLLTQSRAAPWVLYKLDGGIDHMLVDEAQDTSPVQWSIVKAMTEEFFSGEGARAHVERTLFVVGDRKQSIYSFQGADPDSFDAARRHFKRTVKNAGKAFRSVDLVASYRSVTTVLKAVDDVFSFDTAKKGLEAQADKPIIHEAERIGHAGIVELWPLVPRPPSEEKSPLKPVDLASERHPRRVLAKQVAEKIKYWIENKRLLASRGRAVRPGDILILVRGRNLFFEAMIAELQLRQIPVAGADRLKLGQHIAVLDLLSLARFVLLPDDDLSLAEVLKSPLIPDALNDDDLFELAYGRDDKSLWDRLKASRFQAAHRLLESWIKLAQGASPFEFFSAVLLQGEPSGRKRFQARLGGQAADPIDAFLDRVLAYEMREAPSLQGFVSHFTAEDIEIKRDMEQDTDEVRIMTVHGAKGLEANIVMIPDAAELPRLSEQLLLANRGEGQLPLPCWKISEKIKPDSVQIWEAETRERAMDEYRRQLYVAMTRARDELYVGGIEGRGKIDPGCWYELVRAALAGKATETGDGTLRLESVQSAAAKSDLAFDLAKIVPSLPPSWALERAADAPRQRPWLRPSELGTFTLGSKGRSPLGESDVRRFRRGILMHKLLQFLPELSPDKREEAAQRFLKRHHVAAGDARTMAAEVLAVLHHPEFGPYFASGSLAEVSLAALLGNPESHIAGRVDRLAISSGEVRLLDFKTDRIPATSLDDIDPAYLAQLAAYSAALFEVFPQKTIHAALLWTQGPSLMPVPHDRLYKALKLP